MPKNIEDYIKYEPCFLHQFAFLIPTFESLLKEVKWEQKVTARKEAWYCNDLTKEYTYGSGNKYTTHSFKPEPFTPLITQLESYLADSYEGCHINYYDGQHSYIGWHSDDSPLLRQDGKIAVISLGAAREIWFREKENKTTHSKLALTEGSLLTMLPGCQDYFLHRIPKNDRPCGPRISLTFRQLN